MLESAPGGVRKGILLWRVGELPLIRKLHPVVPSTLVLPKALLNVTTFLGGMFRCPFRRSKVVFPRMLGPTTLI